MSRKYVVTEYLYDASRQVEVEVPDHCPEEGVEGWITNHSDEVEWGETLQLNIYASEVNEAFRRASTVKT